MPSISVWNICFPATVAQEIVRVYHLQKNFRKSERYLKSAHFKRDVTSRDHGELEDNQMQTNLLIPSRVTIEKSNKAKYF